MERNSRLVEWSSGELVPCAPSPEAAEPELLLAADSFRVSDGTTVALGMHAARFRDSAVRQGHTDPAELDRFWSAGVAAIPRAGAWFPRFEFTQSQDMPTLRLCLRTAPPLETELIVATAASDPRLVPDIKGPDIDRLSALRQRARHSGADEAVILDEGVVSDGATTALLWWRGDTLFTPPLSRPRVDSVAARTVRAIAAALRIPVDEEEARPAHLEGTVVWAVNALHGIRTVTAWPDGPVLAQDSARLTAWRTRFAALVRPLPPSP